MGEYKNLEHEIIQTMQRFGGSFVRNFAVCYQSADLTNRAKLQVAFADLFLQYDDLTTAAKVPVDPRRV